MREKCRSGQVFLVWMPISRWQVNRDLKIHILCGVLLISTVPNLCVDVVLKRSVNCGFRHFSLLKVVEVQYRKLLGGVWMQSLGES